MHQAEHTQAEKKVFFFIIALSEDKYEVKKEYGNDGITAPPGTVLCFSNEVSLEGRLKPIVRQTFSRRFKSAQLIGFEY